MKDKCMCGDWFIEIGRILVTSAVIALFVIHVIRTWPPDPPEIRCLECHESLEAERGK